MVGVSWDIVLGRREYIFQGRRDYICEELVVKVEIAFEVASGSMLWSAEVPLYSQRRPEGHEEAGAVGGGRPPYVISDLL